MKIFYVIVQYGDLSFVNNLKFKALNYLFFRDQFIIIRTDVLDIENGNGVNDAFEFSGYQAGLNFYIKEKIDSINKVIFLNDTIFDGHLFLYILFLIFSFQNFKYESTMNSIFLGVVDNKVLAPFCEFEVKSFLHTYAFGIIFQDTSIVDFCFYKADNKYYNFNDKCWIFLSNEYKKFVDGWLNPVSLFRGWPKSLFYKKISNETLLRKRNTIFLEHNLLSIAIRKNINFRDVGLNGGFLSCATIFARNLDIAYLNVKKIISRLYWKVKNVK